MIWFRKTKRRPVASRRPRGSSASCQGVKSQDRAVRRAHAQEAVDHPAQRRPGDGADVPRHAVPGRSVGVELAGHDLGGQGRGGGGDERPGHARQGDDGEDRDEAVHPVEALEVEAEGEQKEGPGDQEQLEGQDDPLAVAQVGDVPGVEGDGDERHGLGQADEPERERIARELIDLPADDEALHLDGQGHEEPEADEQAEIPDPQGAEPVRFHAPEL